MVFQNYALYPHMSVFDNMALPLTMSRLNVVERLPLVGALSPRRRRVMEQIAAEVKTVAEQLRIESYFARRPAQLSGGQRQRVALGRAMVRHPDVFLMDEPLSNLDAKLRVHMRSELAELHARLGVTMVYVTHDQIEAMTMADRLAVMDQGMILQLGTPTEVYERPASVTVAQFIGSPAINLLPAMAGANGRVELLGTTLPVRVDAPQGGALTIGVRPESVHLRAAAGDVSLPCRFRRRENLGSESILHFDLIAATPVPVLCKVSHGEIGLEALSADGQTTSRSRRRAVTCSARTAGDLRPIRRRSRFGCARARARADRTAVMSAAVAGTQGVRPRDAASRGSKRWPGSDLRRPPCCC
jgi:multiple sugar transport system ATP-binding protein